MKTIFCLVLLTTLWTCAAEEAWVTPPVCASCVEQRFFESTAAKTKVSYFLYTPDVYAADKERRFPVLYWLHGSGGGEAGVPQIAAHFDAAIRAGKIPPLLVVFPNGMASSMWCNSADGRVPMETVVIKELIPHVDATCRTLTNRASRLLEGFSMGGYGAARLGFKYHELFGAVSIFAGGPFDMELRGPRIRGNPAEREQFLQSVYGGNLKIFQAQSPLRLAELNAAALREDHLRIHMATGERDSTLDLNRQLSEQLKQLNIPHTFTTVPGVGHDPKALLAALGEAGWEFYRAALGTPAKELVPPGKHDYTLKVGEWTRRYTVQVPSNYDGKKPLPVVIMLHGGGGTSKGAAEETGWDAKADKENFLAVLPNALARDPEKPGSFSKNPQLWNDGSERFFVLQKAPDDVAFLNAMLDELCAKFSVDERRIFVAGFSNGASMTFRFGAAAAQRIAAIAPGAGACWPEPLTVARPVSMCYLTGKTDPLNLLDGGTPKMAFGASTREMRAKPKPPVRDSILKWAKAIGCPMTAAKINEANGVRIETFGPGRENSEIVFVTVADQGHTWAGGKSLLPESWVGKRTDKLNATDFIWDFFKNHPAPAKETK
ncbi:MAG: alpha/beta hydrolase-fold protein [Kiritimatiellaeota bacterium]|nr:alpha/beta hydrolase-fold protein [Kiritimatiellota bacterium]